MEKQEYLRPHDVSILLQLAIQPKTTFRNLADKVSLSLGETHNAAKRLDLARLVLLEEQSVHTQGAIDFLVSGVPYSFPPKLGAPTRGIATAFSAPPLATEFPSNDSVVWPESSGRGRGSSLTPLTPAVGRIWERNRELYELLTLVDAIRIGRARERKLATKYLEEELDVMRRRWTI